MSEAIDLSDVITHDENSEVSPEELAALLGGGEPPQQTEYEPSELETAVCGPLDEVIIPAVITLDDGREFHVPSIRAWAWTPFGIYGVGRFADDADDIERNVLFAGRKIASVELQVDAYEEFVDTINELEEPAEAEVVEDETPSD